jgi:hypothetical protein
VLPARILAATETALVLATNDVTVMLLRWVLSELGANEAES